MKRTVPSLAAGGGERSASTVVDGVDGVAMEFSRFGVPGRVRAARRNGARAGQDAAEITGDCLRLVLDKIRRGSPFARSNWMSQVRPMRADARRNYERLLKAAAVAFAEHGRTRRSMTSPNGRGSDPARSTGTSDASGTAGGGLRRPDRGHRRPRRRAREGTAAGRGAGGVAQRAVRRNHPGARDEGPAGIGRHGRQFAGRHGVRHVHEGGGGRLVEAAQREGTCGRTSSRSRCCASRTGWRRPRNWPTAGASTSAAICRCSPTGCGRSSPPPAGSR